MLLIQPKRYTFRLHGVINSFQQCSSEFVHIHLVAGDGSDLRQGLLTAVFFAVKAAVDEILDTQTQGIEQGCNRQGGEESMFRLIMMVTVCISIFM